VFDGRTVASTFKFIDAELQHEVWKDSQSAVAAWRANFQQLNSETWKAARSLLKPPEYDTQFTAEDLARDCEKVWTHSAPVDANAAVHNWMQHAALHTQKQSKKPNDWLPSFEEFSVAVFKTSGGASFDGWRHIEMKLMFKYFPVLAHELYDLWVDTTNAADI